MTNQTEAVTESNLGVIQIKDAILELDRLLEVYKSVDVQNLMMEYFSGQGANSMLKEVVADVMKDGNFIYYLAPTAASRMFAYIEEHSEEEDNNALNVFFNRISRGITENNYDVKNAIYEKVKEMTENYMNSSTIQQMIKDRVAESLTNVEVKTQVVLK
jgi:hypothetical protein